jgi:hypothetical protein
MATIVIKDLPESTELDRKAMLAIAGGSRFRAGGAGNAGVARAGVRRIRLFDLSPGGTGGPGTTPAASRPPSR